MNHSDSQHPQFDAFEINHWVYESIDGITSVDSNQSGSKIVFSVLSNKVVCVGSNGHVRWIRNVLNPAWRVGISDDGDRVAVGTDHFIPVLMLKGIHYFDGDGEPLWFKDLGSSSYGFSISSDGNTLAVGTEWNNLVAIENIIEKDEPRILWQMRGKRPLIYNRHMSTALSKNGEYILSGSADSHLRLFNRKGLIVRELQGKHDIDTVAISGDGGTIVAGDRSGYLFIVSFEGQILWDMTLEDGIIDVEVSRDGKRIVVGADEEVGHVYVFDRAGKELWSGFVPDSISAVEIADFSYDVIVGTETGQIYLFDKNGTQLDFVQAGGKISAVTASARGNVFVAVSMDHKAYGFHIPSREIDEATFEFESIQLEAHDTFGKLFKRFRQQTTNPDTGKRLTQGQLADYLSNELDLGVVTVASISQWENDVHAIDNRNRHMLLGLAKALIHFDGVKTANQLNQMLKAGEYRPLDEQERRKLF